MTPFTWKNCFADVQTCKHHLTIQAYFEDVILPALCTIDSKIEALANSDWPSAAFARADMQNMLREAKIAFGLSIQSIWERQLRCYLTGCAGYLRAGEPIAEKIERANWKDLCKWFRELRDIRIEDFPSFDALDLLHHLGNACRHGEGASAEELVQRCPDLWPPAATIPPMPHMPPGSAAITAPRQVAAMDIPVERLRIFVTAISAFWQDHEYIYNESIQRKDPHLEAKLAHERANRAWVPQASHKGAVR